MKAKEPRIKISISIPRALCPKCEKDKIEEVKDIIKGNVRDKIKLWLEDGWLDDSK